MGRIRLILLVESGAIRTPDSCAEAGDLLTSPISKNSTYFASKMNHRKRGATTNSAVAKNTNVLV